MGLKHVCVLSQGHFIVSVCLLASLLAALAGMPLVELIADRIEI